VPEPLSLGVPVLLLLLSVSGLAALSVVRLGGGRQKGSGRRWRYTPNRRRRRSDLAAALRVAKNVLVILYNPDPTPDPSIIKQK
jgi:hypothetical protein